MGTDTDNVARARRYISAVESGTTGDALAGFFAPNFVQEEFPNRLMPHGARRDLAAVLEGAERGQEFMRDQRYEIHSALGVGDRVALEIEWSGTVKKTVGPLAEGTTLKARIAIFLEFQGGKIVSQRNYDCYEPW